MIGHPKIDLIKISITYYYYHSINILIVTFSNFNSSILVNSIDFLALIFQYPIFVLCLTLKYFAKPNIQFNHFSKK